MRNIDFRGKKEDDGKWLFGYYAGPTKTMYKEHYILSPNTGEERIVDPNTVGQFTGFEFDGVPIFENDILQCLSPGGLPIEENTINTEVLFIEGSFVVHDQNKFTILLSKIVELDSILEIVGNKFDNSGLLK